MAKFDLIYCVVNFGDASKVLKSAGKYGVKGGTISVGRGTVHSRVLDFLMINEIRKEIVTMLVETELVSEAIKGIGHDMAFDKPNHGIAFSYSLSEVMGSGNDTNVDQNTEIIEVRNSMYKAIYVIVDKGRAEDVVEAAKKAGARGGTIMNARESGIHEKQKLFSIEIEPEREKVFIIATSEMKDAIITAIKEYLEIDETGAGGDIIYIVDVNETYGLH